jgi:hypothetical protein
MRNGRRLDGRETHSSRFTQSRPLIGSFQHLDGLGLLVSIYLSTTACELTRLALSLGLLCPIPIVGSNPIALIRFAENALEISSASSPFFSPLPFPFPTSTPS